jgi:hypothetical protein
VLFPSAAAVPWFLFAISAPVVSALVTAAIITRVPRRSHRILAWLLWAGGVWMWAMVLLPSMNNERGDTAPTTGMLYGLVTGALLGFVWMLQAEIHRCRASKQRRGFEVRLTDPPCRSVNSPRQPRTREPA